MVVVGGNGSGDCEWSHGSHDYAPSGGIVILVGDGNGLAVALGWAVVVMAIARRRIKKINIIA